MEGYRKDFIKGIQAFFEKIYGRFTKSIFDEVSVEISREMYD